MLSVITEKGYIKLQALSCWNTSHIVPLPNPVLGQQNTLNGQMNAFCHIPTYNKAYFVE